MSGSDDWPVPASFREATGDDAERLTWIDHGSAYATNAAERWGLTADGPVMTGYMAVVWPVRDHNGRPRVLRFGYSPDHTRREAAALRAWAGHGTTVEMVEADPARGMLLLQRLDHEVDLERHPDADQAVGIIGDLLATQRTTAATGTRPVTDEIARILTSIGQHLAATPDLLPRPDVDAARATLQEQAVERHTDWLLHFDAHFLNVLHSLSGEEPGWRLIDPLPQAGPLEWECVAILRNRWADVAGTGDPDRALRRRVDILAEHLDLDRALARALAQAVAVDNLLWLLPRHPDHMFVAPYRVISTWGD